MSHILYYYNNYRYGLCGYLRLFGGYVTDNNRTVTGLLTGLCCGSGMVIKRKRRGYCVEEGFCFHVGNAALPVWFCHVGRVRHI